MDILNNIWTAMSTPNTELVKIICILLLFVEAPLTYYLIASFFNIKFNKKQQLIYILTTGFVAAIATTFMRWPYNIILNYATAFIILFFVMKLNFVKSLIATLFPSIIFNLL